MSGYTLKSGNNSIPVRYFIRHFSLHGKSLESEIVSVVSEDNTCVSGYVYASKKSPKGSPWAMLRSKVRDLGMKIKDERIEFSEHPTDEFLNADNPV